MVDASDILDKSKLWLGTLSKFIDGIIIDNSPRNGLAVSLCYISVRHYSAIVLLCERNLYGSAFSLLRAQYETYIRSIWLYHCATERQLQAPFRENCFPGIKKMLSALSANQDFNGLNPDKDADILWDLMCDFTHGGVKQIFMHSHGCTIEQNVSLESICGLLEKSSQLGLLVGVFIITLADNEALGRKMLESFERIFQIV
jgi:hypothetical protein